MKKIIVVTAATIFIAVLCLVSNLTAAEKYEFYIAQGIEKINAGQYAGALDLLENALKLSPDNPEAEFYAAIAYSRLGKYDQAEHLLMKVKKEEEYAAGVFLELGRIYYARQECRSAETYLNKFLTYSEDASAKSYAESLIEDCYGKGEAEKRYKLNVSAGVQYDTNVVLEPGNPVVTADRKRDGRAVAIIAAGARLFKNRDLNLNVDYNFYQSGHFNLDLFNVHYHKISPRFELTRWDRVRPSIGYSFEYLFFAGEDYGLIHTYFANVNIKEASNFSLDGSFEYKENEYKDSETFASNSDRTGRQNIAGLKQNFAIDRFSGDVHYFYDDKRADEDFWAYRGQKVGGALGFRIMDPLWLKATADFERRRHREDFPGFDKKRVDETQKYGINLQYIINSRLAVTLTESYTRNDSNIADFDYDRNIIGLLLTYGLI